MLRHVQYNSSYNFLLLTNNSTISFVFKSVNGFWCKTLKWSFTDTDNICILLVPNLADVVNNIIAEIIRKNIVYSLLSSSFINKSKKLLMRSNILMLERLHCDKSCLFDILQVFFSSRGTRQTEAHSDFAFQRKNFLSTVDKKLCIHNSNKT